MIKPNIKHRYKVLTPVVGTYWEESPPIRGLSKEYVLMGTKEKIDPIFNRNGYYYDRYEKFSWFEFNNEAYILEYYTNNTQFNWFRYDLERHEARNKRLDKNAIEPIKVLIKLGLASKKQIKLLDLEMAILNDTIQAKNVRYRFLKFCKDKGINRKIKPILLP